MTKKVLAIFMAISMALSITACKGEKKNDDSSTAEVTTTTASETTVESNNIIEKGNTVTINNEVYDINVTEVEIKIAKQEQQEMLKNVADKAVNKTLGKGKSI